MIRVLRAGEMARPELVHLLWLACEADDEALAEIVRELPHLSVVAVVEEDRVRAFAAFEPDADPVVIEYLAVEEEAQGRGYGRALVGAVREAVSGRALHAETDDDAVDFYRRLGFTISAAAPDPRWPDRPRYACVLA
ncbi:MAG: GNAT family N-acetyltransferase [Acidimicrobiia bacterium]